VLFSQGGLRSLVAAAMSITALSCHGNGVQETGPANAYGYAQTQAAATGEFYLVIDGIYYAVAAPATSDPIAQYTLVGGYDYAWVLSTAVVNNCASSNGSSLGSGNFFLLYGYTAPALPITSSSYSFVINAYGSASIISVTTFPGNVQCQYSVPPPMVVDEIFRDAFEQ